MKKPQTPHKKLPDPPQQQSPHSKKLTTPTKQPAFRKENHQYTSSHLSDSMDRTLMKRSHLEKRKDRERYQEGGKREGKREGKQGDMDMEEFERLVGEKLDRFGVVAGTIREYVRQKRIDNPTFNYLPTVVSIMKAFTKSELQQMSPKVAQLIKQMLHSLPLPKNAKKSTIPPPPTHQPVPGPAGPAAPILTPKPLRCQIEALQQSLHTLKQQQNMLQSVIQELDHMDYQSKKQYIQELQNIASGQRNILRKLADSKIEEEGKGEVDSKVE